MTGSMLAGLAQRKDPLPIRMGITHASFIEVEAMGAPCMDGGSGAGRKAKLTHPGRTLRSPTSKLALWLRSYCSS